MIFFSKYHIYLLILLFAYDIEPQFINGFRKYLLPTIKVFTKRCGIIPCPAKKTVKIHQHNHSQKLSMKPEKIIFNNDLKDTIKKYSEFANQLRIDEQSVSTPFSDTNTNSLPSRTSQIIGTEPYPVNQDTDNIFSCTNYKDSLKIFERKFHLTTFKILSENSLGARRENGISFVQSPLFLHLSLLALSTITDESTASEIDTVTNFKCSSEIKLSTIRNVINNLPTSNYKLTFHNLFRLVLDPHINIDKDSLSMAADALQMRISQLNDTNDTVDKINKMVEEDSYGAMLNTFDKDDFLKGIRLVLLSTIEFHSQWRTPPTLLNDTRTFHTADDTIPSQQRTTQALRINDIIGYADLYEWDAQAMEIQYARKGLSLIIVIPRGTSLRAIAERLGEVSISYVINRLEERHLGVTLPIYTLRMTLLLPQKLHAMGISKLLSYTNDVNDENTSISKNHTDFSLSHAVQSLMFWSAAGTNAYKDDGIEWEEKPEMELFVDRPYIFFVRWNGTTIMNGHFVL